MNRYERDENINFWVAAILGAVLITLVSAYAVHTCVFWDETTEQ